MVIDIRRSVLGLIAAGFLILFAQSASALNTFYTTQPANATFERGGGPARIPKSFKYKIHLTNLVNKIYGG